MSSGQGVSLGELVHGAVPPSTLSRSFEECLQADLWCLVQQVGVPLVEARLVTTLRSSQLDRACFRLRFADGRVLKGRRVETLKLADRLEALSRLLDRQYFPPILARHGRALLTEWIEGTGLRPADCTPDVLRFVGALHASLHRIPVPNVIDLRRRSDDWRPKLDRLLHELLDNRALDATAARLAYQLAEHHAPERVSTGLCHGDLCGENIVKERSGRFVVVDNDSVAVDSYEYDLARTWYRWPLNRRQRAAYVEGYGQHPHWADFTTHFIHWAILVLTEAAAFRLRVGVRDAHKPLNRLRGLLGSPDECDGIPRAVML